MNNKDEVAVLFVCMGNIEDGLSHKDFNITGYKVGYST